MNSKTKENKSSYSELHSAAYKWTETLQEEVFPQLGAAPGEWELDQCEVIFLSASSFFTGWRTARAAGNATEWYRVWDQALGTIKRLFREHRLELEYKARQAAAAAETTKVQFGKVLKQSACHSSSVTVS